MDGRVHHFSAGGLYNGLVLLVDEETGTYWDHISGEAVHGPLAGQCLPMWGIEMATVESMTRAGSGPRVHRAKPPLLGRIMPWLAKLMDGRLPPGFRGTMGLCDPRLPAMEIGLGVVTRRIKRFYRVESVRGGIEDDLSGRRLRLAVNAAGIPRAVWLDDGTQPVQLFTRWYGFAFTFPGCGLYQGATGKRAKALDPGDALGTGPSSRP